MKRLLIILLSIGSMSYFAQTSCCSKPGTDATFAMLTQDKKFVASHLEPLPFTLENPLGKDITFKTTDGSEGYGYEIKAVKFTRNYLFVFHEWWGLNDHIKQEAEKYYKTLGNVNVIAIDIYDRRIATTRDSAAKYAASLTAARGEAIIKGALNYAGEKVNIATIGWCLGGGYSMKASLLAGTSARGCVMYYGTPEDDVEKLRDLFGPVLFIWPKQDKWINKEMVTKLQANMANAKKDLKVIAYDADHAFANPSNPKYNKEFAEDAFKNSISFLKKRLK